MRGWYLLLPVVPRNDLTPEQIPTVACSLIRSDAIAFLLTKCADLWVCASFTENYVPASGRDIETYSRSQQLLQLYISYP